MVLTAVRVPSLLHIRKFKSQTAPTSLEGAIASSVLRNGCASPCPSLRADCRLCSGYAVRRRLCSAGQQHSPATGRPGQHTDGDAWTSEPEIWQPGRRGQASLLPVQEWRAQVYGQLGKVHQRLPSVSISVLFVAEAWSPDRIQLHWDLVEVDAGSIHIIHMKYRRACLQKGHTVIQSLSCMLR